MEDKPDEGKLFFFFLIFHVQGMESRLKPVISFVYMKTAKPYLNFCPEILELFRK